MGGRRTDVRRLLLRCRQNSPQRTFRTDVDPDRVAKLTLPPVYSDQPLTRKDWANYLASVEKLDQNVGLTLKWLRDDGLESNTVVFFLGNDGQPYAWAEQSFYDAGIGVPLILK